VIKFKGRIFEFFWRYKYVYNESFYLDRAVGNICDSYAHLGGEKEILAQSCGIYYEYDMRIQ
jgi:hypothetical protein